MKKCAICGKRVTLKLPWSWQATVEGKGRFMLCDEHFTCYKQALDSLGKDVK